MAGLQKWHLPLGIWDVPVQLLCLEQAQPYQYPRMLDLPDVMAARKAALKIADIFVDVVPHWDALSS